MTSQPENSGKKTKATTKTAAYAATLAIASTALNPAVVDARLAASAGSTVPFRAHTPLWGRPAVAHINDGGVDAALNIPRGGTDEAETVPPSKMDSGNKPHKAKKKKRHFRREKQQQKKDRKSPGKEAEQKTEATAAASDDQKKKQEKQEEQKPSTPKPKASTSSKPQGANSTSTDNKPKPPTPNPMMEEILKSNDFYEILGLRRGEDNVAKIKKSYRRRAVQTHPDKTGGDRRAFDKLAEAYDVLLDDEKRALYDRYGKAGLDPTRRPPPGARGAEDLFRSFFGQPQQQQQRAPVNPTLRYQLEVTLEDLYVGRTRSITIKEPQTRRDFFYPQFTEPPQTKLVEVNIPRGAHPGQSIVLHGESDFDSNDSPPGDVVFQLQPRPHKVFTRKGHDLAMTLTISFSEAIGGCTRKIRHLSGKTITVESAKHALPPNNLELLEEVTEGDDDNNKTVNVYIQPGDVQVLRGQGMPKNPQGTDFGDLYIQYEVELPQAASTDRLTPTERLELARLMEKLEGKDPAAAVTSPKKGISVHRLEPAQASDFGRASGPVPLPEEDHHHPHVDDHHQQQQRQFPFEGMGGHRQFFFSSSGQSPFFGQENNFEDDENVQCRQM